MLIKPASDIRSSEITPEKVYVNRREFIRTATGVAAAAATGAGVFAASGASLSRRGFFFPGFLVAL